MLVEEKKDTTTLLQDRWIPQGYDVLKVNIDLAINGILFKEIKYFACLKFNFFRISYCPRVCNKVADALAMYGAVSG